MTTIFFIVDGRGLEAQATLLAATLWQHNGTRYPLLAYLPERHVGAVSAPARALFARCGVELRPLPGGPRAWHHPYPHGNKLLAAADRRDGDWSLFLDTDMICLAPLDLAPLQVPGSVGVLPEGVPSWGRDGDRWARAYAHFGLPLPEDRVTLTRRKRRSHLPYFNAGFVLMPEAEVTEGRRFGQLWLETALDFDWNAPIGGKRPWLDQITLPLTLKRFGLDYNLVSEDHNYSISDRAPDPAAHPHIIHYHRWSHLAVWPQRALALATLAQVAGQTLYAQLEAEFGDLYHADPAQAA